MKRKAGIWAMARGVMLALGVLTVLGLGACDSGLPARDYDELIGRMMGSISGKTAEEAAANLFNVSSPDERRDAIAYLAAKSYGHEPAYMRAYEVLAEDKFAMVRAQALRALGASGQASAVPVLVKGLSDADEQVRRDAAAGLVTTWGDAAAGPVAARLTKADEEDAVRVLCARALARAREPDAQWALIGALRDRNAAVVWYARESLVAATKQDFSYDYRAWLDWYQKTHVNTGGGGGGAGVTAPTTRP